MKRSFLRSHLMAWIACALFIFLCGPLLLMAQPKFLLTTFFIVWPRVLLSWAVPTLFMWRLAVLLGRHDILVLVPVAISVALGFSLDYSQDVWSFLPDDGHTLFDVCTFGARPFDVLGQASILGFMLFLVLSTASVGIALKRTFENRQARASRTLPVRVSSQEWKKIGLWLAFDLSLIVCVTAVILHSVVENRIAQGKPDYLIRTLQSQSSSIPERLHALWELMGVQTDEATQALRRAAREQQPPINLRAAAALLVRNDISELEVLEEPLMHPHTDETLNLGYGLASIKDPAAISVLVHLMTSPEVITRRGAASALRNIASPSTTDALIKGLDDSDVQVRYFTACTLIEIAGDGHYPSQGLFEQNEEAYLDHWKAWARQRAAKP